MLFKKILKEVVTPVLIVGLSSCLTVSAKENTQATSQLKWKINAGLGYDSNIYRAPGQAYIDYAKKCTMADANCVDSADNVIGNNLGYVMVNPQIKSGVFIPAELKLDYAKKLAANNVFLSSYKAKGEFYAKSQYSNANNYGNKLTLGDQMLFSEKKQSLYVGGLLEYKKRLYLDRDTGADQETAAGVDISGRYTYDAYGLESLLEGKLNNFQYAVNAAVAKRNYKDPVVVSQYDHTYYTFGGETKYKLSQLTKLSIAYNYYMYNYVERPSRSLDGRLLKKNPPRKYGLNSIDVTLRQRLSNAWLVYLDYQYKTRTDKFQGYDNYAKNMVKMRLHYVISRSNRLKLSYSYWKRDYANAFAFDNADIDATAAVVNTSKSYDGSEVRFIWRSRLDDYKTLVFDVDYYKQNSTDLRYDYTSYQASASFRWRF